MTFPVSHDRLIGRDDDPMSSCTGDDRMSGLDTLVWNVENDPRLRSTVTAIFSFDEPINPADLRRRLDRVSRLVPRLHQRVVNDPLAIAPPRWEVDPDFCLGFHFRVTTLGGQGTPRQLHDLTAAISAQALDRSRPLWEFTLVKGLADGGCALVIKAHHALTDGVGAMELMLELCDLEASADPTEPQMPPRPAPPSPGSGSIDSELRYEASRLLGAVAHTVDMVTEAAFDPIDSAQRLGAAISSARRILTPVPGAKSSVMGGRSLDLEFHSLTVPLRSMKQAGRRVGGTVNDAFIAAIALAVRGYHLRYGASLESLRISVPVNRRIAGDGAGNHFTPGRIQLDTTTDDPDELMRRAHRKVDLLRHEPANALIDPAANLLRLLPTVLLTTIASALSGGIDVAASNIAGSTVPLHLCGHRLTALIPFGPLVGCAANVTMVSFDGCAHIGVNCDPAAVDNPAGFTEDLRSAFDKILGGS